MDSIASLRVDRTLADVRVFDLVGDHDMASAPELEAALDEALAEERGIVLDLAAATFIDSSIMHVLARTQRALDDQGRELALCVGTASIVRRALEVALPDFIAVAPDRAEAITIATARRRLG
jgi:anti-sigma B factor antagonist